MFRIRRIFDSVLSINQAAIRDVQRIFAEQFSAAPREDVEHLAEKLRDPFKLRFQTVLYVAEKQGHVAGFAIVLHEPVIGFCYLDYLATGSRITGRGVGAALYERVRDEALGRGAKGLFFESLPDEAASCADAELRKQNAARLKFYERYGARPIIRSDYEAPIPGVPNDCMPHLVYDGLDQNHPLRRKFVKQVVQAILERKYGRLCPPQYVQQVVESFREDPVPLRALRYVATENDHRPAAVRPTERIAVTVNDKHDIHHIRERGYVEAPVRISAIESELVRSGLTEKIPVREFSLEHILAVHDRDFVEYLRRVCATTPVGKSVYPYVFPIRNATRPPKDLSIRAGYYCIDTFTPVNNNAFPAARRAVDCALTAADAVLKGRRIAYALVRPPGHHAERRSYGGFCYFNNAAVAAHYLSRYGKVAILDVDYHHGNGQQDIFYERSDVLTVSIHGDPEFAYPYFTGFADERGAGVGEGFNINLPLPESLSGDQYRQALRKAIEAVRAFTPQFLVVALGLDPAKGDPTGTWLLTPKDFEENGRLLGALELPTLVVQEGGYRTRTLGVNARHFFRGLAYAASGFKSAPKNSPPLA
jgi:acetoin utilization deacetylase AcuC-like enzyme/GNAT superfamily N-acetyltransferase